MARVRRLFISMLRSCTPSLYRDQVEIDACKVEKSNSVLKSNQLKNN